MIHETADRSRLSLPGAVFVLNRQTQCVPADRHPAGSVIIDNPPHKQNCDNKATV